MSKKEYINVFSKMIEHHNNDIVSLLKRLRRFQTLKIGNRRILNERDSFENQDNCILIGYRHLCEYCITNNFIFKLLLKSELDSCFELINSPEKENILIGCNMLYNLIELKKTEILNKEIYEKN